MRFRFLRYPLAVTALAAVYFGAAKLGLQMALVAQQVTPVWPPTGIAMAALFLWGIRLWPAITIAALLVNATTHESLATAAGIAAGNTLEAILAVCLLRLLRFRPSLERLADVPRLLGAACISPVVSASCGVLCLCLGRAQPWAHYGALWFIWWLGDAMGALVVAPAIFTAAIRPCGPSWPHRRLEAIALLVALVGVGVIVFSGPISNMRPDHPLEYAVFPIIIWAALRFGQPGATMAALVTAAIAIVGTAQGSGPFYAGTIHEGLVRLAVFLAIVATTALFLGAAVTERFLGESRRATDYDVSRILAESARLDEAMPRVLGTLGHSLGWQLGRFWTRGAEAAPRVRVSEWRERSRETERDPGCRDGGESSLVERAWVRGEAETVSDAHPDPMASGAGRPCGAFACPVRVRGKVFGVMEFFGRRMQPPDRPLLQMFAGISRQIGQFVERTQTEEAVRQSEERYRGLVEQASDGIFITDLQGSYFEVNNVGCAMTGYSRQELIRLRIGDLLTAEELPRVTAILDSLRSGQAAVSEWLMRRKDGRLLPVEVSAKFLADGRLQGIVRDITHRQQAEQAIRDSERRFRALFENSWDAVAIMGADGTIRYSSPSVERILGYTPEEFQGRNRLELVHAEDRMGLQEHLDRLLAEPRTSRTIECRTRARDGSWLWIEGTGSNLLDEPTVRGIVWNFRDVGERKRSEEALREADRRKDEFLAMLAHELRNPLAPIANATHVLRLVGADDKGAEARSVIERQVQHLTRLVDDLLDVSRITRGKIQLRRQPTELADIIRRAVEAARPLIEARGHHLEVSPPQQPIWLQADPTRVAQVLANLLHNAAKYTDEGGHISLSAACEGAEAMVRVRDSGVGIAADLLPRVFELFTQGDRSLARSEGGLGIGLTLVQRLVELHGGRVEARSAGPGRGSEFIVYLPILHEEPGNGAGQSHRAGSRQQLPARHVLVVDDNVDSAMTTASVLSASGQLVRVAHDGPQALEAAAKYLPEIVFLDIGLPKMDGYEVARRLRQLPGLEKVLLVAVTGYGQDDDRRRSQAAGIDHHFVKPVPPEVLESVLAGIDSPERRA